MRMIHFLLVLIFASSVALNAQSKPSPKNAKAFIDFYFNGQGSGVVLADMKVCTEINKETNEPMTEINTSEMKIDEKYLLWMMYVVPKDDKVEGIIIQFNQGGLTRFTREASVSGSIRYRTWKSFKLNKSGEWEIKVLYDNNSAVEILGSVKITVTE